MGDVQAGNEDGGSSESRAITFCVELITAATLGRDRVGGTWMNRVPANTSARQAAAAARVILADHR